jgi:hypothetical protein
MHMQLLGSIFSLCKLTNKLTNSGSAISPDAFQMSLVQVMECIAKVSMESTVSEGLEQSPSPSETCGGKCLFCISGAVYRHYTPSGQRCNVSVSVTDI